MSKHNNETRQSTFIILACLVFAIGLIGLAWLGWQSRYMQDDYCFDFLLKQDGFFTAQWRTYFEETAFNGNRYTANFIMGLSALVGAKSAQIMPFVILVAITASLYLLATQISHFYNLALPITVKVLVSLAITYLIYTLTPNLFQSLYWRPASVTYSLPIASVFMLGALVLVYAQRPIFKACYAVFIFLLAFISGGFAEHMVTLTFCVYAIVLLFTFLAKATPALKKALIAALSGTAVALLVMLISPAAHLRRALLFPDPPALGEGLRIAFEAVNQFILRAFYRLPMHTFWTLLLFAFCGYLFNTKEIAPRREKEGIRLGLTILLGYGLLFSLCLPGALTTSAPPEERAQVLLSLVWVLMVAALGWQFGALLRGRSTAGSVFAGLLIFALGLSLLAPAELTLNPAYPEIRTWLSSRPLQFLLLSVLVVISALCFSPRCNLLKNRHNWLTLALFIAAALAVLPGLVDLYRTLPARQNQAALWDWREGQIEHALKRGRYNLSLPALDSIAGVLELQESEDHWVNNCAELFYGLDSLQVEEPVITSIPDID